MNQIRDLNNKRICDISNDRKTVYIRHGDCVTQITIDKTGKLIATSRKTQKII